MRLEESQVIALTSHKGGAGKTTTSTGLTYALSEKKYKTLLIDSDPQSNATSSMGFEEVDCGKKTLFEALRYIIEPKDDISNFNPQDYIIQTEYDNIDIMVADDNLAMLEMMLLNKMMGRDAVFKYLIDRIVDLKIYDFIIFDTNPHLGIVTANVLNASEWMLIPVQASAFGVKGLLNMTKFYNTIKNGIPGNNNLKIAGILLNQIDHRKAITEEASKVVKDLFGEMVLKTEIPIDTQIEQAQWRCIPVASYKNNAKIVEHYRILVEEVLKIVSKKGAVKIS